MTILNSAPVPQTLPTEVPALADDRIGDLSSEEARILAHLREERPELVGPFLAHLDRGRRGILHRLLQAAIRENIAGTRNLTEWLDDGRTLWVALLGGGALRVPVIRRPSLDRLDFGNEITLFGRGRPEPVIQPRRLLELILNRDELEEQPHRFALELENSAANYALALVGAERRRRELAPLAQEAGARTSLDWVQARLEEDETFSPLTFFEQWVIDGHPLHPGAKIKMGMSVADVLRDSPEWGACPGLALVAVRRDVCRVDSTGPEGPAMILSREYPGLRDRVADRLARAGLDPADFELVPVHPWQFANTLPTLHAAAIRAGEVVPIPEVRIPAAALMSVRSLAPIGRRGETRHQVKTALAVQMTGAVRTVSPNAAANGPALSRVMAEVARREQGFDGRLVVLSEDVGIAYQPSGEDLSADQRKTLGKNLAAILRENPEDHAGPGEIALPAAALLAASPIGNATIGRELIERFAARSGLSDPTEAAVAFLKRYAEVTVPGVLTLMTRYGIGLEGHLQNSVMVFRDSEPVRLLVRDLGGVRILPERLTRRGIGLELLPDSATEADDADDLRNKVYYAFFQNHFGELIASLTRALGIEERALWRPVASTARAVFDRLKADSRTAEPAEADEAALFRPRLALKAMATMRLLGDVTDYTFSEVPNPLAEAEGND